MKCGCGGLMFRDEEGDFYCLMCPARIIHPRPEPLVPHGWRHEGTKRGPTGTSRRSLRNGG